jgi:DNA-damage-inducible protein D
MEAQSPDFELIKQISPYQVEYWSARDLAPLLGYNKWQNFEVAIQRAMVACQQVGQIIPDHFTEASKAITGGKGAKQTVKDYLLSRFACYLIAQNGDPRKKEIAEAQAYFAISTRQHEIAQLLEEQEERLKLRERVSENNKALASAASHAGVLSQNFGVFQNVGYKGLYGGLGVPDIKERKQIDQREDLLDRMGRAELAANDFRITQTEERLRKEGIIGQTKAMDVHHEVGKKVRKAIEDIGGTMPEDLAPEPSIKPLLDAKNRKRKKLQPQAKENTIDSIEAPQDTLWES